MRAGTSGEVDKPNLILCFSFIFLHTFENETHTYLISACVSISILQFIFS